MKNLITIISLFFSSLIFSQAFGQHVALVPFSKEIPFVEVTFKSEEEKKKKLPDILVDIKNISTYSPQVITRMGNSIYYDVYEYRLSFEAYRRNDFIIKHNYVKKKRKQGYAQYFSDSPFVFVIRINGEVAKSFYTSKVKIYSNKNNKILEINGATYTF